MSVEGYIAGRLRAHSEGRTAPSIGWQPPTFEDFEHEVWAIGWDGALVKTAYVVAKMTPAGPAVAAKGTLRTETGKTSFEGTFDRAMQLSAKVEAELAHYPADLPVLVERPAIGGFRTESSLMACWCVTKAAADHGMRCSMISRTHVNAVLAGPGKTKKSQTNAAMIGAGLFPSGGRVRWNQDERDAYALVLTYFYDLRQERTR